MLSSSGDLFGVLETVRHFSSLKRYVEEPEERGEVPPKSQRGAGIRLDRVSFGYEDDSEDAVGEVSLELPAGSVVAIGGENRAGKSTLIKLLCGLMRPTSGRVSVDGLNLSDIQAPLWQAQTSGRFRTSSASRCWRARAWARMISSAPETHAQYARGSSERMLQSSKGSCLMG